MTVRQLLACLFAAAFAVSAAIAQEGGGDGDAAGPVPRIACTRADATPLRTFSLAYQPFPEPYAMFGAQLSEAAEEALAALGLTLASRADADVVLWIRYGHARVGEATSHEHYAFMLVGSCPVVSLNYFTTRDELLDLVGRYMRGELQGAAAPAAHDEN
jgi:hypothetical protein